MSRRPCAVLGVTHHSSLRLMRGFPEYLNENGWEVHVVCSTGASLTRAQATNGAVHYHGLKMERNPSLFQDVRSLVAWVRLCREVRPDLISVGTPKAGFIGGLAGWLTRVPRRIYHQRGLRLETSKGVELMIQELTERISVGVAHSVLAVSPSLRDALIRLRISTSEKIFVVGSGSSNGVNLREFDPSRFGTDEVDELRVSLGLHLSVPTIGFVGRLSRDKGFDLLEEAVRQLQNAGIVFNLLIVGDVDDPTSGATLSRLLDCGLAVVATGTVDDPAIYFQLMDLFCLPTYREGFPNVVLEASASGKATVTTDATGAIDSVIPGVTGSIVPMGDSNALASELKRLLANPSQITTMGEQARRHVEDDFDRVRFWKQLLEFYNSQYELRNTNVGGRRHSLRRSPTSKSAQ